MTTLERVLSILLEAGYRELPKPLSVASLTFDFAAALIARERALDLIVVVNMDTERDERRLVQNVQSLGRALDLMRSRRPLTVILVGTLPNPDIISSLKRVCRVLDDRNTYGTLGGRGTERYPCSIASPATA
jgi:hypothetical protein